MGKPAAVADPAAHGSPLSPGLAANVLIENKPAWKAIVDQHACPPSTCQDGRDRQLRWVNSFPTVLIEQSNGVLRARAIPVESRLTAVGPISPILMGSLTVLLGTSGLTRRREPDEVEAKGPPLKERTATRNERAHSKGPRADWKTEARPADRLDAMADAEASALFAR